jgi:hypothetical protein
MTVKLQDTAISSLLVPVARAFAVWWREKHLSCPSFLVVEATRPDIQALLLTGLYAAKALLDGPPPPASLAQKSNDG